VSQSLSSDQRLPNEAPPVFSLAWGSAGSGDGEVVAPWRLEADAEGNVLLTESAFNHQVKKSGPCVLQSVPGSDAGGFAGGSDDFLVDAQGVGSGWTAAASQSWVSINSGAAGNGNGVVLFPVTANPGSAACSGTMMIGGQTFTVNQDPEMPDAPGNLAATAINSSSGEPGAIGIPLACR
jgi:hypothetical protein